MNDFLLGTFAFVTLTIGIAVPIRDFFKHNLSAASLFCVTSLLFVNIGMIVLWFGSTSSPWRDEPVIAASGGLLAFITGKKAHELLMRPREVTGSQGKTQDRADDSAQIVTSIAILAIASLYFVLLGTVPALQGLLQLVRTGSLPSGFVNELRNSGNSYIGDQNYVPGQGFFDAVRFCGAPLVFLWAWMARHDRRWGNLPLPFMIGAFLLVVGTGQRWPTMFLCVASLLAGVAYFGWTPRKVFAWLGFAFTIGVALTGFLGRGGSFGVGGTSAMDNSLQLLSRFTDQVIVPFSSYSFGRESLQGPYSYTWIQNLVAYLPGPGATYPVDFSRMVTGDDSGFTAPPDFYTEAWINTGLVGVILLSAAWGFCLDTLKLAPTSEAPRSVGYRAVMAAVLGFSAMSGVSSILALLLVLGLAEAVRSLSSWAFSGPSRVVPGNTQKEGNERTRVPLGQEGLLHG